MIGSCPILGLGNRVVLAQSSGNSLSFPVRGAFYYPWYPETWRVNNSPVFYEPDLGNYYSEDLRVVQQHIQDMEYAKINLGIASWWGINEHSESNRLTIILNQTEEAATGLKWAMYYEKEGFGNPSLEEIQTDLKYIREKYVIHQVYAHVNNKPVIFVYNADDNSCEVANRWTEAANGEWYVSLKIIEGYENCTFQPDTWHQYGPDSPAQQHSGYSYVIAPGFWKADQAEPLLERDPLRWTQNVAEMVTSGEPWQLITTFNEWGEGTAIERCNNWKSNSPYGVYLDALHFDGMVTSILESKTKKKSLNSNFLQEDKKLDAAIYNLNGKQVQRFPVQRAGLIDMDFLESSKN